MNIVYIFGNGLDKAQGLATGYPDFYNYLLSDSTECSRLLKIMKDDISADCELWSDMEERLGEFTEMSSDAVEFEQFYYELSDYLQNYLSKENAKFSSSKELKEKFEKDLAIPNRYIGEIDNSRYNAFVRNYTQNKDISIITLNYTNVIESILSMADFKPKSIINSNIYIRNLIHLHGRLGDSVIIGVDNDAQIANPSFKENEDIKDLLLKEQSNRVMKNINHYRCEQIIKNAQIIVLFGVSLGETDARWWQLIGENLMQRKDLAVIEHLYLPNAVSSTRKQRLGKLEHSATRRLLRKMNITDIGRIEDIANRLFFVFNSDAFRL